MKTYKITGRIYDRTPYFYDWDKDKKVPYYKEIEGSEKVWHIQANTIDEAKNWFRNNHKDYFKGSSIVCTDTYSFIINAAPHGYNAFTD